MVETIGQLQDDGVRHPPRSGWLDELGRLKGGRGVVKASRVARLIGSELPGCSIRRILLADVLADLLQFEPDRGDGIAPGPEMFAREVPFFAAQPGNRYGTLPCEKPDHRGHRVLGGNRDTHGHMVWHQMPFENLAFFLPRQRVEDRPPLPTGLAEDDLPSSFGHEYHMVLAVPFRMG
jgi:hypothetical protein